MLKTAANGVRYHQFEILNREDVVHGVFARVGGVSPAPWAALNVGGSIGDERERVIENRRRSFEAVGLPFESIADLWQVHSADAIRADAPKGALPYLGRADALVTDRPGVSLYLRFADCVPILLCDPVKRAVGIVHAGWRGTVIGVTGSAVRAMTRHFGSRPADILAAIGPSIGPDHYEVGSEVVEQVHAAFPGANGLLKNVDGRTHLDLWQANARALREAGVEQIEIAGVCTACNTDLYFSHRGEAGKTGRFGAVIALRSDV
ncbi:MAG: peptidoglycan editing factor PgeF [Chloroflexi bacterium]|nr:peptidoglycan editing factor PgeF [Chloroflexota bacterium]